MTRQQRLRLVLDRFRAAAPDADTELRYSSTFQLLVAVVLSAQCTDRRVNIVTPALFARYPDAAAMSHASADDLFELISSISYPRAKSRHLAELARMLQSDYGGQVPHEFDELLRLPGVGRKTANVVRAVAFGCAAMPVDTHVYRVSHRLRLVTSTANTPLKVERQLLSLLPTDDVARAHHWLLLHGRYVCTSRAPHCIECMLADVCPSKKALQRD